MSTETLTTMDKNCFHDPQQRKLHLELERKEVERNRLKVETLAKRMERVIEEELKSRC